MEESTRDVRSWFKKTDRRLTRLERMMVKRGGGGGGILDTGWVDLSTNGAWTAQALKIRRSGAIVHLHVRNLTAPEGTIDGGMFVTFPQGFRALDSGGVIYYPVSVTFSNPPVTKYATVANVGVSVRRREDGDYFSFNLSWMTDDDWPTL